MMEKPARILHIMSSYGGGISSFIRNKAKSVDPAKITLDVVSLNIVPKEFEEEIEQNNGKVFLLPNPKKTGFKAFAKQYKKILKENGPYDIVHSNLGGYRSFLFYLISKSMGVERFIVHAHSSGLSENEKVAFFNNYKIKMEQSLNRIGSTDMLSCGSNASRYYFGEKALENQKIMHIPNSIDLDKYMLRLSKEEIIELKKENNLPFKTPIIGQVGRFDENKNQEFQVEVIKEMAQRKMNFFWIFIGEGKTKEKIEKQIEDFNLEKHARVLGRREDVNKLYQMLDILVLTSYSEGFPTVCVESQAAGVPCVISDTITREIDMGLDMVRFAPLDDTNAWIFSIVQLLNKEVPDDDVIKKQFTERKFTNPTSAKLYEDFVFQKVSHYEL